MYFSVMSHLDVLINSLNYCSSGTQLMNQQAYLCPLHGPTDFAPSEWFLHIWISLTRKT